MDKLKQLLDKCKCSVDLNVNQHRDYYMTATERLKELDSQECPPEIDPWVRDKMIELNTVIELHFYPDTPIGSYHICHYDLDLALDMALECLVDK